MDIREDKKQNIDISEEMIGPRWTTEQEKAITQRGKNILVSAAAGSGKTSVMVERIRRMVMEEDVPVESLLVVTFTNAAASEMKERIRKALVKALSEVDPGTEKSKNLRKQIRNLYEAQISTFHAFGTSVIRRFFYLIDLEPGISVGDETQFTLLKNDAMDTLMEEKFLSGDENFISFMNDYSGDRSDREVRNLISEAYTKINAMPHGFTWAKNCISEMEKAREKFADSSLWKIIYENIRVQLNKAIYFMEKAVSILGDAGLTEQEERLRSKELEMYLKAKALLDAYDICDESKVDSEVKKSPQDLTGELKGLLEESMDRFYPPKGELQNVYAEIKDEFNAARKTARAIVIKRIIEPYLSIDLDEQLMEIEADALPLKTLIDLTERFAEIYHDAKSEAGIMDFDDIEHYTLEILEKSEAAEYYKKIFRYIFIDEYQDTNLMQEAIIERIKGDDNLFMVGDIKQSIYKFRLAEPSIFKGKYDGFKTGLYSDSIAIDLNQNHRSKSPIIDFINGVFRPLMKDYDEDAELNCGDKYDGEHLFTPEIHLLVPNTLAEGNGLQDAEAINEEKSAVQDTDKESYDEPGYYEEWDSDYVEARHVAEIIKENLGRPFFDSKGSPPRVRPLKKRDIVVLLRGMKNCASLYDEALQDAGIDAYIEGDDGYFDTMEIEVFVNLLTIIDNLMNDVALISVLHSDIFGFSASDLARMRVAVREGSFAEVFLAFVRGEDFEAEKGIHILTEKCKNAMAKIEEWRKLASTMPLEKYIWHLLIDSGSYITMGALPKGGARQANLRALCDMAESFSDKRQATLYSFLNYIGAIKKRKVKIPEASRISEGEDAVRIMTIHKSKGLEFPMVIVAGLGKQKRYGGSGTFSIHKDVGLALTLKSGKGHWQKKILTQRVIGAINREEEEDEEIRVLYVALTRARDILYLTGYEKTDIRDKMASGITSDSQYMTMILPGRDYKTYFVDLNAASDVFKRRNEVKNIKSSGELTEEEKEKLLKQLDYVYPHEEARKLKSKYSVSEINNKARHVIIRRDENSDIGGEIAGLSAAEKGTAYHKIMERLSFSSSVRDGISYIETEVNKMLEMNIISNEELNAIDLKNIDRFFKSELGKRAAAAEEEGLLERERPFTMIMEKSGEEVLVQGIIDCYFTELVDGKKKTTLLDYKSNRIFRDRPMEEEFNRMRSLYSEQIDIYKTAINEAGEGPVTESYLYLLDIGETVVV